MWEGVALEIQYGIHDMFEHFGSGDGAFFGHVTYQQDGYTALLGPALQASCALPHLADAACCRIQIVHMCCLDGIHDERL